MPRDQSLDMGLKKKEQQIQCNHPLELGNLEKGFTLLTSISSTINQSNATQYFLQVFPIQILHCF